MRRRVRIQPYISPDLHRQLRRYTAAHNLSDSAVAEAALAEYLSRATPDEGVVLARLQALSEAVARLQYDVDVQGHALGTFVRYAFRAFAADSSPEAVQRAHQLFTQFAAVVARELDSGLRLTGQIDRARSSRSNPQTPGTTADGPGERT